MKSLRPKKVKKKSIASQISEMVDTLNRHELQVVIPPELIHNQWPYSEEDYKVMTSVMLKMYDNRIDDENFQNWIKACRRNSEKKFGPQDMPYIHLMWKMTRKIMLPVLESECGLVMPYLQLKGERLCDKVRNA